MKKTATILAFFVYAHACAQDTPAAKRSPSDTFLMKTLDEVVVSASRIKEQLSLSPVSIEKLNEKKNASAAAPSFFDALQNARGVQMITPSLGFRVINTRGFTNTTNVRFAQLTDGMDIQSPHIGAPAGNALGPTDLDIKSAEIITGSASALYGMNAINGMANFLTKDPFYSAGVSVQQKTGINHVSDAATGAKLFSETTIRVAQVVSQRFAFKINAAFSKGYDWVADDHTDLNPLANSSNGLTGASNPGYDGVNSYGNESSNRRILLLQGKSYVIARTGYDEKDVASYSLQNTKADAGLYFKPTTKISFKYTYHVAHFNTVYQRSNRFQLKDYVLQQHGLEFSSPSVTAKAYINRENTGASYNLRSMAENIDRSGKNDDNWFTDFAAKFNDAIISGAAAADAQITARLFADAGRPQPGSAAFKNSLQKLQSINNWDSGSALRVKASLVHAEVQWDITQQLPASLKKKRGFEILSGIDTRTYIIVPDGNYFINPAAGKLSRPFSYGRWGGFVSVSKKMFKSRLKAGIVLRLDKNDYFTANTNIRASIVYALPGAQSARLSYQDGYRYPSVFEAFSNVNSGGVKRVGGLRVMSNGIFESGWLKPSIDIFQDAVNKDINTAGLTKNQAIEKNKTLLVHSGYSYLKPEHLRSVEAGYRVYALQKKLYTCIDLYYSNYQSFIAQAEMSVPNTAQPDSIPYALYGRATQSRYRMWTNSKTSVHNYGFGITLNYDLEKGYSINGNLSYTKLNNSSTADGLEDGFNTPQWMAGITAGNEHIFNNLGAGITWRWQDRFYYQGFLASGYLPANSVIDAQVSCAFPALKIKIKSGATNLLNSYYTSLPGGPQVGGFYYTTITYGLK